MSLNINNNNKTNIRKDNMDSSNNNKDKDFFVKTQEMENLR